VVKAAVIAASIFALGASQAWGAVVVTTGDTYVDKVNGATIENTTNSAFVATKTSAASANQPAQPPTEFTFLQFPTGSLSANSISLSMTTVNSSNGARKVGGYIFVKVGNLATTAGSAEATLSFNNSFLGGGSGISTTDGSFDGTPAPAPTIPPTPQPGGGVAQFIRNAGWTQLGVSDSTDAFFSLGQGVQNTTYSTGTAVNADLKAFYNANLSSTITVLFEPAFPSTGNENRWVSKEGSGGSTTTSPLLTVTEVPEPTTLLLLALGGSLLARKRTIA
jgi:PEP-CTERM motif